MKKFEWRKQLKDLYLPKEQPMLVDVPEIQFFALNGRGDPNTNEQFTKQIETLYSLSYTIRMMPKKGIVPEGYYEYTVFPLEGVWDLDEVGRSLDYLDKNHFVYTLMIRQPEFVTEQLFHEALDMVREKKPDLFFDDVKFVTMTDGLCVQAMHIGKYEDEPKTFQKMEQFCEENNLERIDLTHREIYISDVRRTAPEKLKTVLCFKVKQIEEE